MPLPKVLIFGQPFNHSSGGGITLSNLFNGWEKDKIAVAATGHMLSDANSDICDTYYQLGEKEHKWIFPFNHLQQSYSSGLVQINKSANNTGNPSHKTGIRKKLVNGVFYPLLKYFGLVHTTSTITLSAEFRNWLIEFKPDILYIQVSEREGILFAKRLHSFLNIPMIVHNMDDWPSTICGKGLFKNYWNRKIDKEFRELLNKASLLLSISDSMASEYKKRYGKKFITFHNPINLKFWKQYQRTNYELKNSPQILYAGRIGPGVDTSLKLIAKAIKIVNEKLNMEIKFVLQTQEKLSWFQEYNCVKHTPFIPYSELPKKFAEADFLILPYDFSKESINFIKYSMPTKGPEYMISGTPIIIFAPESTAIVKYAQECKWAKVITNNSYNELAKSIMFLIENKSARETIALNAKKIGEKNHNSINVTNSFKEAIISLRK
jgi:hypothetical protein